MPIPFNPNDQAECTNTLQVEVIRRVRDQEIIEVLEWLPTQTLDDIHQLRQKLRQKIEGERFICFCCGHDVYLRQHTHGGHYFAHKQKSDAEKSKCLYQQNKLISLEDRNRIRYHGQREGPRHVRAKNLIKQIVDSDPKFSKTKMETVWTTFIDGWRKPDVATEWNGRPIAFEAQVSNTYPQVVADRTDFYLKQNALLIWVFDRLIDEEWRALHSDIFCSNGHQLFIVDEDCAVMSTSTKQAHFRIYSQYPEVVPFKRSDGKWALNPVQNENNSIIPFCSALIDIKSQQDVYSQRKYAANHKILCAEAQIKHSYELVRGDIQNFIKNEHPIEEETLRGWAALICAIESKRLNKPIGTKYDNPSQLLNWIYDRYPQFVSHLINTLERLGIDHPNFHSGAWKMRVKGFKKGRYKNGELPKPHPRAEYLLQYIYPRTLTSKNGAV